MSMNLGRVGVWTFAFDGQPMSRVRDAAAELDELGYGAIWFGEGLGRDALTQAALLLNATERLVVATGIANIFLRDPIAMAAGERTLAEAFPDRFLLGLGGHRTADQPPFLGPIPHHGRPLPTVRAYLDAMDQAPLRHPAPAEPPRRVLAALGPRMLELAAERTWGAHPYFVPVEHTARAREIMGPDALLAVEQTVILERPDRARELARGFMAGYAQARPRHQEENLRRLGFGDDDLAGGGSDRLLEALIAWGDVQDIAKRVREHFDAGADHVCVQVMSEDLPRHEWRELAPALLEL
ncbi:TIGR03620 family F420-dependent LLM class oxidoreductase [Streptosporangium roseum]|uniref:TIGR03620 family F420-dependent LLM class oxidoreductase n=1 Tax=Streptosporangium roseum TaxID=2001 RepID=UPI0004CDCC23|nr:TIGR03620 family F420-dependent LLM class oxidoreductase [Streptosporangium roseum]